MIEDCDPADIYESRTVTGRKEHTCGECGGPIPKGEAHIHAKWLFDGRWGGSRMCHGCEWAAEWLTAHCRGYVHGAVLEDLVDHYQDHGCNVDHLALRIWGIRRKWPNNLAAKCRARYGQLDMPSDWPAYRPRYYLGL